MRPQYWVVLTLTLVFLGALLQLGGVIAPMWVWLQPDDDAYLIGVGLYFRVGCESSSGGVCPAVTQAAQTFQFGYTDAETYDKYDWVHLTWLETLAGALALILCVMVVVYTVGFGVWRWLSWMNTVMVITAIFTWLPIAAGLILFAVERGKVITTSPDLSARSFPWSALMCFLAGIIFVIVTILIRVKCRVRRYVKNAVPPSADSKMMLNPSTKNQLINRFFTPSPYREDRRQALQSNAYYNDQSALLGSGSVSRAITSSAVANGVENSARAIEYDNNASRIHVVEDSPYSYSRVVNRDEVSTPLVRTGRLEQQEQQQLQQIQERQLQQQQQRLHVQDQQQQRQQHQNIVTRTTTTTTTNQYRSGTERNGHAGQLSRPPPTGLDSHQDERIIGHETVLSRHGQIRSFDETTVDNDDAETIYYRGRGEVRPRPLHIDTGLTAAEGYRTTDVSRVTQQDVRQSGFEQQAGNSAASQNRQFFRVGASQDVGVGDLNQSQYTVHMRQVDVDAKGERLILNPAHLRGGNHRYNNKYIYRPYSEQQLY